MTARPRLLAFIVLVLVGAGCGSRQQVRDGREITATPIKPVTTIEDNDKELATLQAALPDQPSEVMSEKLILREANSTFQIIKRLFAKDGRVGFAGIMFYHGPPDKIEKDLGLAVGVTTKPIPGDPKGMEEGFQRLTSIATRFKAIGIVLVHEAWVRRAPEGPLAIKMVKEQGGTVETDFHSALFVSAEVNGKAWCGYVDIVIDKNGKRSIDTKPLTMEETPLDGHNRSIGLLPRNRFNNLNHKQMG
jgi:hypothetical protein